MSVETHPLNSTGFVGEPISGDDFNSNPDTARGPLANLPPAKVAPQARRDLEPRERAPKGEKRGGFGFGRLLLTVSTSLIGGGLGAWGYQQWLAPVLAKPTAIASAAESRASKPPSIEASSVADDADDEQNKVLLALRSDLDRLRGKFYAVQLRLNGIDSVAKPVQTPELNELKPKVAELTIQVDRLNQMPSRVRAIDERIEQIAVTLKSIRDDLQTVQEMVTKSTVSAPRTQAGAR